MTEPTPAPVVLFDLDDTLMAHREAVAAGIVQYMRVRAYDGDELAASRLWHELEEEHYRAYLDGALSFEGQRRARAAAFAREFGDELDDPSASEWFAEYFRHYRDSWTLHDDVLPALDALSEALPGVRFGIVTNGELEFQTAKIVRLALDGRVEQVVASGDVGIAKPEAGIFHEAVRAVPSLPTGLGRRLRRRSPAHRCRGRGACGARRRVAQPPRRRAGRRRGRSGECGGRHRDPRPRRARRAARATARAARDVRTGRAHPHAPDPSSHRTLR